MEKVIFALLLIGSGASVGLAGMAGYLHYKMHKLVRHTGSPSQVAVMAGVAATNGVLLERLIEAGTADPSLAAWMYTGALTVVTGGLGWSVRDLIVALAQLEADNEEK